MALETRVLVVDDHPLFREGVVATISKQPEFRVVAEAVTIDDALKQVRQSLPDILLLDVALPDGSGVDAIAPILELSPNTRIVMLTVDDESDTVLAALRAGATGYMLKGTSANELVTALRAVAAGQSYTSPQVATRILSDVAGDTVRRTDDLSPRERTVFELLGHGLTNREIAEKLTLSEKTIKGHVTVILHKLGVRNRVEAALLAADERRSSRRR